MTNMKRIVNLFLAVLLLPQCVTNVTKFGVGDLVEIVVSHQKYPVKELYLQDIAEVEYIPLETNRNTLMRSTARIVHVSDDYIITSNTPDGDIFVFDGKGKSKFSFNHKGRGPEEYNVLYSIAFDEKTKEIFVFDSANPRFLVYNENGNFKRTLASAPNFLPIDVYDFDEETLLAYDVWGVSARSGYSEKPYTFISKKDGSIVDTLGIHSPVRFSNRVFFEVEVEGQKTMQSLTLSMSNNRSYGKNFLIADWGSDTIYRLTPQKKLQPVIVRKPSLQKSEPKIIISNELITDKFIILDKSILDFEKAKRERTFSKMGLMFDFETGQLTEYKLINRDFHHLRGFSPAITPENTGVSLVDVSWLFEANRAGRIRGELKELLSTLKEEDNPILMKVKFNSAEK